MKSISGRNNHGDIYSNINPARPNPGRKEKN